MPKIEDPQTTTAEPITPKAKGEKKPANVKAGKAKAKAKGKSLAEQAKDRPVIYDSIKVELHSAEKKPLTADVAKALLLWQEEDEATKFGDTYTLELPGGAKVRCDANVGNRPLDLRHVKTLEAEILRRNWRLNGETMIVGNKGTIISGQHRLIALVLADLEWQKEPSEWPRWETPPFLETILVKGIPEDDETINTIDTGKPRSLSDVIYRSEHFASMKPKEREKASRAAAYAIKFLGHRTDYFADAFSPKRTNPEMMGLLARHEGMLVHLKHVTEEDSDGRISSRIGLGYAAALCYLMSASTTNPAKYHEAGQDADESFLDFSMADKAEEFWVNFANSTADTEEKAGGGPLKHLLNALNALGEYGSMAEKIALIVTAWNLFSANKKVMAEKLELKYEEGEEGVKILAEHPVIGGIDVGGPREKADEDDAAAQAAADYDKRQEKRKGSAKPAEVGDHVWVTDADGDWEGKVTELYGEGEGKTARVEQDNGKSWETAYDNLSTVAPE